MNKLMRQMKILDMPHEAIFLAGMLSYRLNENLPMTRVRCSICLADLTKLKKILEMNNIYNDVINRELVKIEEAIF